MSRHTVRLFEGARVPTNMSCKSLWKENAWWRSANIGAQTEGYETGYEGQYGKAILPDRVTHQHKIGADHPTPFAKGCEDHSITPLPSVSTAPVVVAEHPHGIVAEKLGIHEQAIGQPQVQEEGAFEPAEAFSGKREGFVYKTGSQGLGYYQELGAGRWH